jgi:hypothetical protein
MLLTQLHRYLPSSAVHIQDSHPSKLPLPWRAMASVAAPLFPSSALDSSFLPQLTVLRAVAGFINRCF